MPLDPRAERFLDVLAAAKPHALTVQERRRGLAELMQLAGPRVEVDRIDDQILRIDGRNLSGAAGADLPVKIYTPLGTTAEMLPGLVYFHGGGFVAGSPATHDSIGRALANAGACRVVSVDYRLAPENPFPAAIDDALAAVTHVGTHAADFGIDGACLGICGDSAGATLAAAACQALARIGGPRLALQLLICPILDYSASTASRRDLASGYLLEQTTLDHDLLHYVPPGVDPADPRISPLRAQDVSGLPRTLIHTAEFDPVRDEGREYFERLTRAHGEVSYTCHPGMIHLFYGLGGVIPYARMAFELIGRDIRASWPDRRGG
ncbi:MAG: alpha/beta hydrolase [Steroidobacteraceae bacterium]